MEFKLCNVYIINEGETQTHTTEENNLFSEESKAPRTLSEAGEVAGSAICKQCKTVLNCV